MTGFVTLACPSCGGTLYLMQDAGGFTCVHCGKEGVVRRDGDRFILERAGEPQHGPQPAAGETPSEPAAPRPWETVPPDGAIEVQAGTKAVLEAAVAAPVAKRIEEPAPKYFPPPGGPPPAAHHRPEPEPADGVTEEERAVERLREEILDLKARRSWTRDAYGRGAFLPAARRDDWRGVKSVLYVIVFVGALLVTGPAPYGICGGVLAALGIILALLVHARERQPRPSEPSEADREQVRRAKLDAVLAAIDAETAAKEAELEMRLQLRGPA